MTLAQVGSLLVTAPHHLLEPVADFGGKLVRLVCVAEADFKFAEVDVCVGEVEESLSYRQVVFVLDAWIVGAVECRQEVLDADLHVASAVRKVGQVVVDLVEQASLRHQVFRHLRLEKTLAAPQHFLCNCEISLLNQRLGRFTALPDIAPKNMDDGFVGALAVVVLQFLEQVCSFKENLHLPFFILTTVVSILRVSGSMFWRAVDESLSDVEFWPCLGTFGCASLSEVSAALLVLAVIIFDLNY